MSVELVQTRPSENGFKDSKLEEDNKGTVSVTQGQLEGLSDQGRYDAAAEFLALHAEEHGSYTEAEARRVLRKIDWRVVPLMTLTVTLNSVDVSRSIGDI
jgi:hypothetical protein